MPVVRDTWTDNLGVVHEARPGTGLRMSRCGLQMGATNDTNRPPCRGCPECVDEALREYALNHDCAADGCRRQASERQE